MFRRGKLAFLSTKDDRIKIVNERINLTEKHLIELCCCFATCTSKLAKYRDAYDELARSFKNYADDEQINATLNEGLKSFANATTILGDYMDVQVHRMEAKIVNELALYDNLCKSTRENLRSAVIARDKEVLKQRQMLELKSKFNANNSATDPEVLKAKLEVSRTNKEIDDIISNFEQRKLSDIKAVLADFVLISMKFHTKALEALSASYYDVTNIDEHSDFMDFQKLLKTKEESTKGQKLKSKNAGIGLRSQSMESLERDQLLSSEQRRSRLSRSTKNLAGRSDDELDDDGREDEGEDDEEDDEEEEEEDLDEDEANSAQLSVLDDGDDSGSASEDYVDDVASKAHKTSDIKEIKSKFQAKPVPHVLATKLKQNQTTQKPFAAKSVGIPSTTTLSRRTSVRFVREPLAATGPTATAAESNSRLVAVVESKKTRKRGNDAARIE